MRTTALSTLVAIGILAGLSARADALPAYSRLYQGKYGYRAPCELCHTSGGGSAVNDYGRDFLRAGANLPAFGKIESKDSDSDGIKNIAEITAKANPGDPRSTPDKLGDWLANADQAEVPTADLKKIFPSADAFAALEGSLKPEQVTAIGKAIGATLADEDRLPTFYFALKTGKRYAVAEYVSIQSEAGLVTLAVAMDTNGTVSGIKILKNPASKAIEDATFLAQFRGKKRGDPVQIGKDLTMADKADVLSNQVALAVRKAIATINAVFAKVHG